MFVIDSTLDPLQERRGWHGDKDLSRDGCGRLQGYAEHNALLLQMKSSRVQCPVSLICVMFLQSSIKGIMIVCFLYSLISPAFLRRGCERYEACDDEASEKSRQKQTI